MASLGRLKHFLDRELQIGKFRKDMRNGLRIRGNTEVQAIAVAANTSFANIRAAAKARADLLIVHHGGWESPDDDLLNKKFALLRKHHISLYIVHLPLDCKAGYGNPFALAHHLGLNVQRRFAKIGHAYGGVIATTPRISFDSFCAKLCRKINPTLEYANRQHPKVHRIAITTGSAGRNIQWLNRAIRMGCDTFLCGEANSRFKLHAAEKGISFICAGHTATERYGLFALADLIKQKFGVRIVRIRETLY